MIERFHFTDACVSLGLDGELVEMEGLVVHEAARDIRSTSHQLTISRDGALSRSRRTGHSVCDRRRSCGLHYRLAVTAAPQENFSTEPR